MLDGEGQLRCNVSSALDGMQITGKELLRLLKRKGCTVTPGKGSHFRVDCGACVTTVAAHASETIPEGTLSRIKRDLEPCLGKGWLR